MKRFIFKRFLLAIPVIVGVSTLVFLLIHMIPGNPVEVMLGERALPADAERLRNELGLDRPLSIQYLNFLSGLARGNMGVSFFYRKPVLPAILERYPATLELTAASMCLALIIALPLGLLSARRPYSSTDRLSMLFSLFGATMPSFWLGPLLILIFAIHFDWLPVSGRENALSLILPSVTLGLGLSAILSRMIRSGLLEVLDQGYITAARARGAGESKVFLLHALRNALIPLITILGIQFGALLSGAIVTETIFSWPGIGRLLVQAIEARDYPLVQGCVLVIAISYIIVNLAVDILYAVVDPRVRYEK